MHCYFQKSLLIVNFLRVAKHGWEALHSHAFEMFFLQEKQKHVTFSLYHQWAKLEKVKKLIKNSLIFLKILFLSY